MTLFLTIESPIPLIFFFFAFFPTCKLTVLFTCLFLLVHKKLKLTFISVYIYFSYESSEQFYQIRGHPLKELFLLLRQPNPKNRALCWIPRLLHEFKRSHSPDQEFQLRVVGLSNQGSSPFHLLNCSSLHSKDFEHVRRHGEQQREQRREQQRGLEHDNNPSCKLTWSVFNTLTRV